MAAYYNNNSYYNTNNKSYYDHNNNQNNNYLHPYYVPSWNNPMTQSLPLHNRGTGLAYQSRPQYPMARNSNLLSSPMGLTEVLSSYTPGPTVIMMEKKRKFSYLKNKNLRLLCLIILILTVAVMAWTKIFAKSEDIAIIELLKHNKSDSEPSFFIPPSQYERENITGYTYLNRLHNKYTNVVFSYNEDEETFLEDVYYY